MNNILWRSATAKCASQADCMRRLFKECIGSQRLIMQQASGLGFIHSVGPSCVCASWIFEVWTTNIARFEIPRLKFFARNFSILEPKPIFLKKIPCVSIFCCSCWLVCCFYLVRLLMMYFTKKTITLPLVTRYKSQNSVGSFKSSGQIVWKKFHFCPEIPWGHFGS